jgi:hypothetical protein
MQCPLLHMPSLYVKAACAVHPKWKKMNTYNPAPTRISHCRQVVRSLIVDLAVPACARSLISVRLADSNIDLEQPVKILRFRIRILTGLGCVLMTILSTITTLWMLQGMRGPGVTGAGLFAGTLVALVGAWRVHSHASTELWLRTHVAQLGLATELLALANLHPSVRTYLESALQLYDAPRGLDVLLARKLAKHEYSVRPSVKTEAMEQAAMHHLMDLPYLNDI